MVTSLTPPRDFDTDRLAILEFVCDRALPKLTNRSADLRTDLLFVFESAAGRFFGTNSP